MTLAPFRPVPPLPFFLVPERNDEQIGLELRRIRKSKFGDRGSLAKVAKDADVSIALIGAIERGDHSLGKVSQERITRLAQAYGMTNEQFADLTGISIVSPTRTGTASLTIRADTRDYEVSDSLQEAVDQFGGRFPKLKEERWQRWLATTEFRDEPETPEDWLAVFLDFEKKINPR